MSATFGGYGLPLNGLLPAALCGPKAAAYALDDENTRPAAAPRDDEPLPPADVTEEDGLIKARPGGGAAARQRRGRTRRRLAGNETLAGGGRRRLTHAPAAGHRRPHLVRRGVRPRARLRALVLRGAARRGGAGPVAFRS